MTRRAEGSINVRRRTERGIRWALNFELWRRERAAELLKEAGQQLEAEARQRLREATWPS